MGALYTGVKGNRTATAGTITSISQRLNIPYRRARTFVLAARRNGALDLIDAKTGLYRKSDWGSLLLQMWRRAGWRPTDKPVNQGIIRGKIALVP